MQTRHGWLLVALAASRGAATKLQVPDAGTLLRQSPGSGVVQLTAAPLLLTLLKDLRTEAEAGLAIEDSMARWCQDAVGQMAGMEQVFQRQVDEANNEVRQVELDGKRLSSEASLINSTTVEKEEQLLDSTVAVEDASAQLTAEKRQLETMLEATNHAIQLLDAQSESPEPLSPAAEQSLNAELVSNLVQLQHVADLGASPPALAQRGGQGGGFRKMKARQMRETLVQLRGSLQGGLSSASREEQEMKQKHWIFSDHLNSSVMEIQSQIAAIKMQVAQRKRESLRLGARIGDLTTLLKAATEGRRATEATCAEDIKQKAEIAEHIKAESFIVQSMLKQAPSGSLGQAGPSGAPAFLQVKERSMTSARALQHAVDDLENLAKRFPQEAAWYSDGAQHLSQLQAKADQQPRSSGAAHAGRAAGGGQRGEESTALQNIRQFVAANNAVDAKVPVAYAAKGNKKRSMGEDEVSGMYANLAGLVHAKEQAVANQRDRCAAILRDATVDQAALTRSLKRADAKRRVAEAMRSEYEQNAAYNKAQAKLLSQLMQRLGGLSKDAGGLRARARDALRGHAEELMALASDLGQQPTADEQRTAHMVRSLAQKVHGHQRDLQRQHARFLERKSAADAVDDRLLRLLLADAEHNRRRLVRLQAEEQLLAGLTFAKAHDRQLGDKFMQQASQLCSADGLSSLEKKDGELRHEEQVLEASQAGQQAPPLAAAEQDAATPAPQAA